MEGGIRERKVRKSAKKCRKVQRRSQWQDMTRTSQRHLHRPPWWRVVRAAKRSRCARSPAAMRMRKNQKIGRTTAGPAEEDAESWLNLHPRERLRFVPSRELRDGFFVCHRVLVRRFVRLVPAPLLRPTQYSHANSLTIRHPALLHRHSRSRYPRPGSTCTLRGRYAVSLRWASPACLRLPAGPVC